MAFRSAVPIVGIALLAMAVLAAADQALYTLDIPSLGAVEGWEVSFNNTVSYYQFLGIPYAESVSGAYRWQPPRAKQPWSGTLNATWWGPACPQSDTLWLPIGTAEDCLFLNVFVPPAALDKKRNDEAAGGLPVMVYVHGGGYFAGTGSDPTFFGDFFANSTDTVVVTINYRLGALGFLNVGELTGNYGIMDQQLALRWVQEYIAAFGGDPSRVTLFGQSAGGISVALHLVVPSSFGLYSNVIVHSNPQGIRFRMPADNVEYAEILARDILCNVTDLDCMRQRSAQLIVDVQTLPEYIRPYPDGLDTDNYLPWAPVVDGTFLPDQPWNLIRAGKVNTEAVVVMGSVQNETYGFLDGVGLNMGELEYITFNEIFFHPNASQVMGFYTNWLKSAGWFPTFVRLSTDFLFTCAIRSMANYFQQAGSTVYVYEWLIIPTMDPQNIHSPGCTENANFVFHTDGFFNGTFTPQEWQYSDLMLTTWASVAHTRAPPASLNWPTYNAATDQTIQFQFPAPVVGPHTRQDYCPFWDELGYTF